MSEFYEIWFVWIYVTEAVDQVFHAEGAPSRGSQEFRVSHRPIFVWGRGEPENKHKNQCSLGFVLRYSLCSPAWPGTRDPPASATWMLGLEVYATTPCNFFSFSVKGGIQDLGHTKYVFYHWISVQSPSLTFYWSVKNRSVLFVCLFDKVSCSPN